MHTPHQKVVWNAISGYRTVIIFYKRLYVLACCWVSGATRFVCVPNCLMLMCHLVWVVCWCVGVVCENWRVDASIMHLDAGLCGLVFGCVFVFLFFLFFVCSLVCESLFVLKGVRWMPWHAEPMKDV